MYVAYTLVLAIFDGFPVVQLLILLSVKGGDNENTKG